MTERGQELLLCSSEGLLSLPLYPAEGEDFVATPLTTLSGQAVYCALWDKENALWLGTDNGAVHLNPDNSITPSDLQGTSIYALHQDKQGVMYFGGELGLFQWQSGTGHWYWYRGEEESDQIADWNRYEPGQLPQANEVFLPPVTGITWDWTLPCG
jgi:ligand-binding sensor domain-containing protein